MAHHENDLWVHLTQLEMTQKHMLELFGMQTNGRVCEYSQGKSVTSDYLKFIEAKCQNKTVWVFYLLSA